MLVNWSDNVGISDPPPNTWFFGPRRFHNPNGISIVFVWLTLVINRHTDVSTCLVPRTLSSYGDRTFAAVGPRLWNSLPVQLRNPDITNGLCRRQLKRHLFGKHEHGALRHMTCSAIGKHFLTYLQTHTHTQTTPLSHYHAMRHKKSITITGQRLLQYALSTGGRVRGGVVVRSGT